MRRLLLVLDVARLLALAVIASACNSAEPASMLDSGLALPWALDGSMESQSTPPSDGSDGSVSLSATDPVTGGAYVSIDAGSTRPRVAPVRPVSS
jgi:hypothetical protein